MKQFIPNEKKMLEWGSQLALACANARAVIFLYGQLGAGKTTLVRGFLNGLGYKGLVKSPTYTLIESYELGELKIFHFDFYRLRDPGELEFMGIEDYFSQEAIFLVEWPEKGEGWLPNPDLSCNILMKADGREIDVHVNTERGKNVLENF